MYYYFDGKEDLFAHVVRVEFERLFTAVGPFAAARQSPDRTPSGRPWRTTTSTLMTALAARPQLAALVRGWLAASDNPALQQAQQEMEQEILPWIERVLTAGQASARYAPTCRPAC